MKPALHIMHRTSVTLGLWLALFLPAHGLEMEVPVTTTNLDQSKYRFSISTNAATGGVSFHVIVTAKREDIHANSEAGLSIVTHTKTGAGEMHSIAPVKPEIPVKVKKDKRIWEADFTVSFELMEKPGLCFVFTENSPATITVDGKSVPVPPWAAHYELPLRDWTSAALSNSVPLYVHFGVGFEPTKRLLYTRIHLGEPIFVGGDDSWELTGKIEERGTNLVADLKGSDGAQAGFYRGTVTPEQAVHIQGGIFSGGVYSMWFLVSTNTGSEPVLERVEEMSKRMFGR